LIVIDIHTHILAGLDDGPKTWEESLEMCRIALRDGVRTMVATPHITPVVYENRTDTIRPKVETLRALLKEQDIALDIRMGSEVWVDFDLLSEVGKGTIPLPGAGGRVLLLHFPFQLIPPNSQQVIINLKVKGITPIITHPERHLRIQEDPNLLYELISAGALSQITAMSLTGGFGEKARRSALHLLQLNLAHIIASDAHSARGRVPVLSAGVKAAADVVGEARATAMVTTIPEALLDGEEPDIPLPSPPEPSPGRLSRIFSRGAGR
jgi:protein-tyrosine phosphatase